MSESNPGGPPSSRAERLNGLARTAPNPNQTILVAGGAGSTSLGFIPRRSVLEAVSDLLARIGDDLASLTDPRGYNIRWLEPLYEVKPLLDTFSEVL